jgi:hypothetical protein
MPPDELEGLYLNGGLGGNDPIRRSYALQDRGNFVWADRLRKVIVHSGT